MNNAAFKVVMIVFVLWACSPKPFRPLSRKEARKVQQQLWNIDSISYFDSAQQKVITVSKYEYYKQ